jgi:hypothetical protein
MPVSEEQVKDALKGVKYPGFSRDIVSFGLVKGIQIEDAAVTVVLAGPDYPDRSDYGGVPIHGIAAAEASGALVFQGGTALGSDGLVTNGGRILSVTARGSTVDEARARAYAAVSKVSFAGAISRRDDRVAQDRAGDGRTAGPRGSKPTGSMQAALDSSTRHSVGFRCARRETRTRSPVRQVRLGRGLRVLICGVGPAALPGVAATALPVIGVPPGPR